MASGSNVNTEGTKGGSKIKGRTAASDRGSRQSKWRIGGETAFGGSSEVPF